MGKMDQKVPMPKTNSSASLFPLVSGQNFPFLIADCYIFSWLVIQIGVKIQDPLCHPWTVHLKDSLYYIRLLIYILNQSFKHFTNVPVIRHVIFAGRYGQFSLIRVLSPNPHNLLRSTICHPVHCIHHSCDHYHQQHLHQQHFHLKNLNPHIVKICQKQREYSNYCTSCCHRVRKDPAKLYPDRPFSVSIIRSQTL